MTFEEFAASLDNDEEPKGLTPSLSGLWHTKKGDWDRAHRIVQADPGRDAAWVHAHLHRIEGDEWNAGYWYRQAGRPVCDVALADEWQEIAVALLK